MMLYQNRTLDGMKRCQWDFGRYPLLLPLVFGVIAPILVVLCVLIGSYAILLPIYKIVGLIKIFILS